MTSSADDAAFPSHIYLAFVTATMADHPNNALLNQVLDDPRLCRDAVNEALARLDESADLYAGNADRWIRKAEDMEARGATTGAEKARRMAAAQMERVADYMIARAYLTVAFPED